MLQYPEESVYGFTIRFIEVRQKKLIITFDYERNDIYDRAIIQKNSGKGHFQSVHYLRS